MLATIRQGSSGAYVKVAQYLIGYAARKKASGIFDADFVAAVCAWQRNHGITPDGIIGKNTWAKIVDTAPLCTTSKNSTSAATCALQILLNAGLTIDGVYGSKTKNAIAAYQSSKGLTADGKCGKNTWSALIIGNSNATKPADKTTRFKQPVDYKQYDSKWAKNIYSNHNSAKQTMKSSACGPTSAADIVATLKDSSVTPWTLAQLYMQNGFRTNNSGTDWGAFKWTANKYGFSKFIQTSSLATLKACIDAGGYVVCSMGPGYWTSGGHFICAWKYESGYIYCNDPASSVRKRQKQADFMKQRKQFFCFYP